MTLRKDTSRTRTPLAIALIIASFLSAFFLATFSQRGSEYWVAVVDMVPGHQIDTGDLVLRHLDLDSSAALYLAKSDDPLGLVVTSMLTPGQLLDNKSVSSRRDYGSSSAVPLSLRGADVASGISAGEGIDIYWVVDSNNGELQEEPVLILGGVTLLNFDTRSKNFGGDTSLTVAVEQTQVLRLLSATTHGRLVVVRSRV